MRFIGLVGAGFISVLAPYAATAPAGITVPTLTIGRNLQAWTSIKLPNAAPPDGLQLTLTSDDPARLLLSKAPDQAGSATLTLTVLQGRVQSPDFCLQALSDSGKASYTISAPGIGTATGIVAFAPSAILIVGPYSAPRFSTTPGANPPRISLVSARLDSARKVAEEQPIAGGINVEVALVNSNSSAGSLIANRLTLAGGSSNTVTYFKPAALGETSIAPAQPPGFTTPAERASIVATVVAPAIAIAGDIFLGKDLQTSATLALGQPASADGLKVTLTSDDSSKLILSAREDQPGSGSLTITVPPGQHSAVYYLQSLADWGTVSYTATAPGYQKRTAQIALARSGLMITCEESGPPPEGNVLRKTGAHRTPEIYVSLTAAEQRPIRIVAWTAYIDQATGRAADFTVQPLRPGISARAVLTSSDPAVARIESPLVIQPGTNRAFSRFIPVAKGKATISLQTPEGFSTPGNATSIPATVSQ